MLKVSLLGTGGTMPLPNRSLTALLCECYGSMILIDCGEGTQINLKRLGWGLKNIDLICLTHYHPDHIVGLTGLLSTLRNTGRTEKIIIIGPKGLNKVIEGLTVITPNLPYDIELIEVPKEGLKDYALKKYLINAVYVEHNVECLGYSIQVKRGRKFDAEKARKLNIPINFWKQLQNGEDIDFNGQIIKSDIVLGSERNGLKISYFTDTRPTYDLMNLCYKSNLLICEGMYGDDECLEKALKNKHMLFSEAATIAKKANVDELWLTHFSPILNNPNAYLNNAKKIFENTVIGKDLMTKELKFS